MLWDVESESEQKLGSEESMKCRLCSLGMTISKVIGENCVERTQLVVVYL